MTSTLATETGANNPGVRLIKYYHGQVRILILSVDSIYSIEII